MTIDDAISFLLANQPLPNILEVEDGQLETLDRILDLLTEQPCDEAIPFLLGTIGEGDGAGLYVTYEGVLDRHSPEAVVRAMINILNNPKSSAMAKYFVLQWAGQFCDTGLIQAVVPYLDAEDEGHRTFAMFTIKRCARALNQKIRITLIEKLKSQLNVEVDEEMATNLKDVLGSLESATK